MGRRRVILALGALALPALARAQSIKKIYRIGWLGTVDSSKEPYSVAFVDRLRELGLVEGSNVEIVYRHAAGRVEQLGARARELGNCDVLFGGGPRATLLAMRDASRNTPIVFIAVDFDASHLVDNPARPGGRITGISAIQSVLPAKRLELLKELLPRSRRVAVLANEETAEQLAVTKEAAARLGLALHLMELSRPPFDYAAAFAGAVLAKADALVVLGSALWVPARRQIPELALKAGLPSFFHQAQWAEAGGLMSYGFDFRQMWRSGAEMVAKLLRGARIADLPLQQPTTYELAINARTAQALGIKIPESIRVRVDRIIQ